MKKPYIPPSVEVYQIQPHDIICTSGAQQGTATVTFGVYINPNYDNKKATTLLY